MSHVVTPGSSRPATSLRTVWETLEPRTACAVDLAPASAMIGEAGMEGGATGRTEDVSVVICAPISEGEPGSVGGATSGSESVSGDDMLLTVTAMPFAVTVVQERTRPARVPPLGGGLAQALAVRPAVMPSRGIETIQVTTRRQDVEDRGAARIQVVPPASRFVRQISARLDRLAFARFGR